MRRTLTIVHIAIAAAESEEEQQGRDDNKNGQRSGYYLQLYYTNNEQLSFNNEQLPSNVLHLPYSFQRSYHIALSLRAFGLMYL